MENLSPETMRDLYLLAQHQGYVGKLSEPNECNSMCDHCPAGPACDYLSEGQSNTAFVRNYKELILPLLTPKQLEVDPYVKPTRGC